MTRSEVVNFMLGCEELIYFVQSQGGMKQLTTEERRAVELYEKILSALISGEQVEYKLAA